MSDLAVTNLQLYFNIDIVSTTLYILKLSLLATIALFIISNSASQVSTSKSQEIPGLIKNNAAWWSTVLISDSDFMKDIELLGEQGIIKVI